MFALFPAADFLSAWLLFTVQPMAAKGLLTELGGARPSWSTRAGRLRPFSFGDVRPLFSSGWSTLRA
jgi:hypothetical protein